MGPGAPSRSSPRAGPSDPRRDCPAAPPRASAPRLSLLPRGGVAALPSPGQGSAQPVPRRGEERLGVAPGRAEPCRAVSCRAKPRRCWACCSWRAACFWAAAACRGATPPSAGTSCPPFGVSDGSGATLREGRPLLRPVAARGVRVPAAGWGRPGFPRGVLRVRPRGFGRERGRGQPRSRAVPPGARRRCRCPPVSRRLV